MLLISMRHGVQIVARCCPTSSAAGVECGMTVAHARALLEGHDCLIQPHDPARDDQALHRLAVWALRYSPLVAPDPPDGLQIDITGCQRLFRGEKRLARAVARDIERLDFAARVAIASTFACAWAVAQCSDCQVTLIPDGFERDAIAELPIAALRIEPDIIEALQEVEVVRVGQILDLPRSELAARFPSQLLLRLDQVLGQAIETIDPIRPKDPPQVEQVFDGPVVQIEAIALCVQQLLESLAGVGGQLLRLERGVRRLDIELLRVDAEPVRLTLSLSHPSRNAKHLWSLLRPRLEQVNIGFGIERIRLIASRTAPLRHDQTEHWSNDAHLQHEAHRITGELIDTIANRLGRDRVLRVQPFESHLPERAFARRSAMDSPALPGGNLESGCHGSADRQTRAESPMTPHWSGLSPPETRPVAPLTSSFFPMRGEYDRPALLLEHAAPIRVELIDNRPARLTWNRFDYQVVDSLGPERIAGMWWEDRQRSVQSTRDYYRLQDQTGRWLWTYRERTSGQWFIHGVWA